jgi:hypothetical protein
MFDRRKNVKERGVVRRIGQGCTVWSYLGKVSRHRS